jgi:hypothetical protein
MTFNITRTASTPVPNKTLNTKVAEKAVVKNIAPLTIYNTETGTVDVSSDSPWGLPASVEQKPVEKKPVAEPDRHAAWKAEQATKKAEREQKREERAVKSQTLAKDFLLKGDLVSAAKAIGLSPNELALYVDNARLAIPNKKEEKAPTLEETVAQLRQQIEEQKKQDMQFRMTIQQVNYIKEHIVPELAANKDKYKVLGLYEQKEVQNEIYKLMNEHFQETGEELTAAEVASSLNDQLATIHKSSIEKLKAAKLFEDMFQKEAVVENLETDETTEEPAGNIDRSVMRTVNLQSEPYKADKSKADSTTKKLLNRNKPTDEEEAEELIPTAVRRPPGKKVHPVFMSREERLAALRAEEE